MARIMYDAINALSLPVGGDLYAGYVDGRWPSANAIAVRFPHATVVRIATSPHTDDGVVGDGPPDNGTWPEWVAWTVRRRAAHVDPTMYTSASDWAAGRAAFAAAHVPEPHWWIAHYDGDPAIPDGAIAKQYASADAYDTSSVAGYWPAVDPTPSIAAPAAHLEEEPIMQIEPLSVRPDGRYALIVPSGATQITLGADGDSNRPAQLRVVLWAGPETDAEIIPVAVGGPGRHLVGHALGGAILVTITRTDGQPYPVAVGFRA